MFLTSFNKEIAYLPLAQILEWVRVCVVENGRRSTRVLRGRLAAKQANLLGTKR